MSEDIKSIKAQNEELLSAILDESDGAIKSASAAGTNMIRRRIREDGFLRNIIPQEMVTNADLDRVQEHDRPVIIEDMEPLSPGAISIPFGASTDSQTYYGSKYIVVFNPITTREYVKDINELRTYRMDLRQVVTDNALKDVQTEEDGQFISLVDTICGLTTGVGATGSQQHFSIEGGITRDSYKEVLSKLENFNLNNGVFLMNRKTAKSFLGWDRSEIGGDLAQNLFQEGLSALKEGKIFGVRHLFTIKKDLVPDNVVYMFTEPSFLGKFYCLSDLTMYVKKEKDTLRFQARETVGCCVANLAGCAKVTFA